MNSIKVALQKPTKVAQLLGMLRSPVFKDKIILVLEGDDDKKIFSKFFNVNKVEVHPIGGCRFLINSLEKIDSKYSNKFIVIKDADFDNLNNIKYIYSNLFLTDKHDLETTLISDDILNSFCLKKGAINNFFIDAICSDLEVFSYLKWYNYNNKCDNNINFKKVKLVKFYNETKLTIDQVFTNVYSNKSNCDKIRFREVDVSMFIERNKGVDFLQLTNGHDLFSIISLKIKRCNRKIIGLKNNDLLDFCTENYTLEMFKKTDLYKGIYSWSTSLSLSILK